MQWGGKRQSLVTSSLHLRPGLVEFYFECGQALFNALIRIREGGNFLFERGFRFYESGMLNPI